MPIRLEGKNWAHPAANLSLALAARNDRLSVLNGIYGQDRTPENGSRDACQPEEIAES
jgi:hypothetical protein